MAMGFFSIASPWYWNALRWFTQPVYTAVNGSFIKVPLGEPSEGEIVVLEKLRDQQRFVVSDNHGPGQEGALSAVVKSGRRW